MDHLSIETLEALYAGGLTEGEAETALSHLDHCSLCMRASEAVWQRLPSLQTAFAAPAPDAAASLRLEQMTRRQIHLNDMLSEGFRLCLRGLAMMGEILRAMIALRRPGGDR